MSAKRAAFEAFVRVCSRVRPSLPTPPTDPRRIFVLRNNDIGDLLVVTPLFEALRERFPRAEILAGIGEWNRPVLEGNPNVDRVVPINAPWHNQQVKPQGLGPALRYLANAEEIAHLGRERCEIGIDVLGSGFGSLLMLRAGIPFRLGVRGYAGGDSAVQRAVAFDPLNHVGAQALQFAALLGVEALPENRPQLFLSNPDTKDSKRVVIAPGGGFAEKRWPVEYFVELSGKLRGYDIAVIGGRADQEAGAAIAGANPSGRSFAGSCTLRETFQLVSGAGLVICNSSMAMHVAAAFRCSCLVLLGPHFASAGEHAMQWGYPETVMLGPERGARGVATVDEAFSAARNLLTA